MFYLTLVYLPNIIQEKQGARSHCILYTELEAEHLPLLGSLQHIKQSSLWHDNLGKGLDLNKSDFSDLPPSSKTIVLKPIGG